jgi:xanthine/CO dehydrogenase XdhC/CoxF family maturation factor
MKKSKVLDAISEEVEKGIGFELLREFKFRDGKVVGEIIDILHVPNFAEGVSKKELIGITKYSLDYRGQVMVVSEKVWSRRKLVVFGGGHVGQAVSLIGAFLGFGVEVFDDRKDILNRSRFPDPRIKLSLVDLEIGLDSLAIDGDTSVVIVTRGHQHDERCLKQFLGSASRYIGMIGSRRRVYSIFSKLEREGFAKQDINRVHAPIGLDIGACSPQEIGLAVMAEIIAHREGYCVRDGCLSARS